MPTLNELEAEIAQLEEKLGVTKALAQAMRAYEVTVGRKVNQSTNVTIRQRTRPPGRPAAAMSDTERVAADLMERSNGPVPTSLVVKAMTEQGLSVPENHPLNVISARLSNNPRFKARRGSGYWFADRPWPGEEIQEPLGFNENGASAE